MMSISLNYDNLYLIPKYVSNHFLRKYPMTICHLYSYNLNNLDRPHFPDRGTILDISAGASDLLKGYVKPARYERVTPQKILVLFHSTGFTL